MTVEQLILILGGMATAGLLGLVVGLPITIGMKQKARLDRDKARRVLTRKARERVAG